ncbi:hypothetical protein WL80_26435 [Burkholderia ubonensis]|uniref:hypothetical protein n=1 Tax=Burkholderia ubonensis TaxID=101571 RepID=UPI0007596006|nr:hypothetical protein [Burkholderia ubonensis]KWE82273.1 hypothetical protein WL80_26435 [Burkholderia ubonensis]
MIEPAPDAGADIPTTDASVSGSAIERCMRLEWLASFLSNQQLDTRIQNHTETIMSRAAQDLIELQRLAQSGAGALTEHLLRELAKSLIAEGVSDVRGGC